MRVARKAWRLITGRAVFTVAAAVTAFSAATAGGAIDSMTAMPVNAANSNIKRGWLTIGPNLSIRMSDPDCIDARASLRKFSN